MDVRFAAVKRVTDQAALAEIARNDEIPHIREAAVERLDDQSVLVEVATIDRYRLYGDERYQHSANAKVRLAAVKRLADQALLATVASRAPDEEARRVAVARVTDQSLLAEIAKAAIDPSAGYRGYELQVWDAVERLTDPALLADVAQHGSDAEARTMAAERLATRLANTSEPRRYCSKKWKLSLDYPGKWEILWENEPDGDWEIVVGFAGVSTRYGRPAVSVRVLRAAAINSSLPRAVEQYNDRCKRELERLFSPHWNLISEEAGKTAGMLSAELQYRHKGTLATTILEKQINLFGSDVTYRLLCETPSDQEDTVMAYFDAVVSGFKPFAGL